MPLVKGKVKVLIVQDRNVWVNEDDLRVCGCFRENEDPVECTKVYQGMRMCVAEIKHDLPEGPELQAHLFKVLRCRNGYNEYYTDREMLAELRGYRWPSV